MAAVKRLIERCGNNYLLNRLIERPVCHTGLTKQTETDGTIVSSLQRVKLESNEGGM